MLQKNTFNIVNSTIHPMLPCEQRPFDLSMKIKRPLIAGFINTPCKQIRENFACGIRNATQGIRNLNNEWKPESKFH